MVGFETGVCYSYNMIGYKHNYGTEVDPDDLEYVENSGEFNALELILDLGSM